MTKPNFTPGPWKLQHIWTQQYDIDSGGVFLGINAGSDAPECLDPEDQQEFDANARLIEQAPRMFEAMERAEKWLGGIIADNWHLKRTMPNDATATLALITDILKQIKTEKG